MMAANYNIPTEQKGSMLFGITVHVGPVIAFVTLMQLAGRSLVWLVVAAGHWFFERLYRVPWQNDGWFGIVLAVPLTDLTYYSIHTAL